MDLDTQNNDSAHASRFLYIFLLSLHDYDVKLPNFTFFRGREHKTMTFFKLLMTPTVPTCNKESLILRLLYLLVMIKRRAQTEECSVYSRIVRIIQDNLSSTRQSIIQTVMILSQSAKKRGLNKSQCMDCPPGQKKRGRCRKVAVRGGSTVLPIFSLLARYSHPLHELLFNRPIRQVNHMVVELY